jgi:hypothetical protein
VPAAVIENLLWRKTEMPMKIYGPEQIVTLVQQVKSGEQVKE